VDLWCVAPDVLSGTAARRAAEALVDAEEARQLRSMTNERRRVEFLVTRALVRAVVAPYLGASPRALRFRVGPHGRPELESSVPLRFSASHCDGLVVCAVAQGSAVGVDVEPVARGAAILSLAPRVFSPGERAALRELADPSERRARAVQLWTLKEAYLKGLGIGLTCPLRSLSFACEGERISVSAPPGEGEVGRWTLSTLERGEHRISVALEVSPDAPVGLRVFAVNAGHLERA
jgi:4'-phosphopantetheinyl transferase